MDRMLHHSQHKRSSKSGRGARCYDCHYSVVNRGRTKIGLCRLLLATGLAHRSIGQIEAHTAADSCSASGSDAAPGERCAASAASLARHNCSTIASASTGTAPSMRDTMYPTRCQPKILSPIWAMHSKAFYNNTHSILHLKIHNSTPRFRAAPAHTSSQGQIFLCQGEICVPGLPGLWVKAVAGSSCH